MFGPANGVSNYLALEKIHCMLILRIRVFWPLELKGHKTITSQIGITVTPGPPLATPLIFAVQVRETTVLLKKKWHENLSIRMIQR